MEVQPIVLMLGAVVLAGIGFILGMGFGGAARGASDADDYLECRHDGYVAGYAAAKDDADELENPPKDAP